MTSPQLRNHKISSEIVVRACTTLDELEDCVRVQREVWKFSDAELVPADIFIVAQKTGGQIIGAFDGDRQVGFTLAFMASRQGEEYLHSHFAAVLPEYQGKGIGTLLKLAQRENALTRGIRLVEWTFDPLALMNAHFNLNRLGAIVRRYVPNLYGVTSSPLHGNIPTDRLVAEWWLESPRVAALAENRSVAEEPGEVQITLPRNATELLRAGDAQAGVIQDRVRREFQEQLAKGYTAVAVRFVDSQASYCLSRGSAIQLPSP